MSQDEAHVALAFEVPGGWRQEKQAIILTVLQVPHLFLEYLRDFMHFITFKKNCVPMQSSLYRRM